MNAHESYCSLETCKLLKQAGFDWSVNDYYVHRLYIPDEEKWEVETFKNGKKPYSDEYYPCPSLSVAQRWLREVKNTHIEVSPDSTMSAYIYNILLSWDKFWLGSPISYATYEEAQEAGIQKCLTLLLEEKK